MSVSLVVLAAGMLLLVSGCPSGTGTIGSQTTCLACHNGRVAEDMRIYLLSAHRGIDCTSCHIGAEAHVQSGGTLGTLVNPSTWTIEASSAVCASCHQQEVTGFLGSAHATSRRVACYDCHDVHSPLETRAPVANNLSCLTCHGIFDFQTNDIISAHTNHPVDPSGTGASRCTSCHMPPLVREDQADGPHSHSFLPVEPIESARQSDNGETVLPNSCAGTTGCHDGSVAGTPIFNIDNADQMTGLQAIFEFWYGTDKASGGIDVVAP